MHYHICKCVRCTLIVLLGLSFTIRGSAQLIKHYDEPYSRKAVKQYYEYINKAEMAIVYNRLDSANIYYNKAFDFKYPNGKDLYNAFLAAFYIADYRIARKYANELAYKGMAKSYIKDSLLNPELYHYVLSQYDSFQNIGRHSKMYDLAQKLRTIFNEDQAARKDIDESKKAEVQREVFQQVAKADSINIERLKRYIDTFGFPSFEQKGFWLTSAPNSPGVLWLVLWHFRPNPTTLDSLVHNAVLEGRFPPVDWATIISCRKNARDYGYNMDIWRKNSYSVDELNRINKSRAAIYLDPIEDYKMKWVIAREIERRSNTEYNPNLYDKGISGRYQFIFLNAWLLPSKALVKSGFTHF